MRRILLIGGGLLIITGFVLVAGFGKNTNTCPTLQSPIDIANVTSILYPGQYRNGDYKAHGGFRLDGLNTNDAIVTAPISAKLIRAGRYIEIGEVQYIFIFETNCGLVYRFDHLLTLAPKFQAVADKLPPAVVGPSEFVGIHPTVEVEVGETIATSVGFIQKGSKPNISFDFGVYLDNGGTQGMCWLDLLPPEDMARLKALPGADQYSGKTSDYCL